MDAAVTQNAKNEMSHLYTVTQAQWHSNMPDTRLVRLHRNAAHHLIAALVTKTNFYPSQIRCQGLDIHAY